MLLLTLAFVARLGAAEPPVAAPPPAPGTTLTLGAPVCEADLEVQRAGDGVEWLQITSLEQGANMNGNVIYSTINGGNSVANGAFDGARGIATIIQNSGNQVIIQNALVLNLTLH